MFLKQRLRSAAAASLKHLFGSVIVAALCGALVFGLWYPSPYDTLVGGRELFLLMISVDVVCGPLLTLIVFNPKKPRGELWRDIGLIVALQLGALGYGLHSTMEARPVALAFEADMFRVVVAPDISMEDLPKAPPTLHALSLTGPRLIGVQIAAPTDKDYLQSITLSLEGIPPAFRPQRWRPYDEQRLLVINKNRPLALLKNKHPEQSALIDDFVAKSNLSESQLGYLPLTAKQRTDWIVIVRKSDAQPIGFLPVDGW